jgi:transcriptional regulator with XRE-family HTH domain
MSETSPQWEDLMARSGYRSIRDLAKACGASPATVAGIVLHGKRGSDETRQKIASALKVSVAQLNEIRTGRREEPLRMPPGTEKLSVREKEAVAEIIRAMVSLKEAANEHSESQKKNEASEPWEEKNPSRAGAARDEYDLVARKRLVKGQGRKPKRAD